MSHSVKCSPPDCHFTDIKGGEPTSAAVANKSSQYFGNRHSDDAEPVILFALPQGGLEPEAEVLRIQTRSGKDTDDGLVQLLYLFKDCMFVRLFLKSVGHSLRYSQNKVQLVAKF